MLYKNRSMLTVRAVDRKASLNAGAWKSLKCSVNARCNAQCLKTSPKRKMTRMPQLMHKVAVGKYRNTIPFHFWLSRGYTCNRPLSYSYPHARTCKELGESSFHTLFVSFASRSKKTPPFRTYLLLILGPFLPFTATITIAKIAVAVIILSVRIAPAGM